MPQNSHSHNNAHNANHKEKNTSTGLNWILGSGAILLVALLFVSIAAENMTERVKFFTVNALSLLVLVAIAVQAYIYRRQWEVMKGQRTEMQGQLQAINKQAGFMEAQTRTALEAVELAKGQLVAMQHQEQAQFAALEETRKLVEQNERAVKAAEDNVTTVAETAIYANRAYVTAKIRGTSEDSTRLQFRLRIENSGNTPANNVRVEYAHELRDSPPHHETDEKVPGWSKERFIVFDTGFTESERLGLIAPKSSYHMIETPKTSPFTGVQFQDWRLEKLKYYCWGTIYYETIFDETRQTEFCFVQSHKRAKGYPCEHGNSAM